MYFNVLSDAASHGCDGAWGNHMSDAQKAGVVANRPTVRLEGFWDVLLEALSYLEDSSWNGFEAAVDSIDVALESPIESPRDVARTLSALGHVDVEHDYRTLRPSAWSVSPATLLAIRKAEWLLCGSRSTRLVEAVAHSAASRGLRLTVEELPSQPARVSLTGASAETVESIVEELNAEGHALDLNVHGPVVLARALPSLRDVLKGLQHSAPAVGPAIQRLVLDDRRRLKWDATLDFSKPGSYRFDPPPLTYVFVEEEQAVPVRVDARLARLLALLQLELPPLAWDPATGIATVPYYAEPPGLYERALSLSNGYGPEPASYERVTRYRGVTEEIAIVVNARLLIWRGEGDT